MERSEELREPTESAGPELRQSPTGGPAFGATQEPEFETDGTPAPPADPARAGAMYGAVTLDDPFPDAYFPDAVADQAGAVTLIAVFTNVEQASAAAQDLERRGIDVGLVSRRGDGPEQGLRPGNVITGPGYGLSAENQSPPKDRPMGAGVSVGATLGATAGLLFATYIFPPLGAAMATTSLVSTLAGAGIGSFLGGLFEFGAKEKGDDASLYAGQVRHGGVLLLARVGREEADRVRRQLGVWNPLEIRVQ